MTRDVSWYSSRNPLPLCESVKLGVSRRQEKASLIQDSNRRQRRRHLSLLLIYSPLFIIYNVLDDVCDVKEEERLQVKVWCVHYFFCFLFGFVRKNKKNFEHKLETKLNYTTSSYILTWAKSRNKTTRFDKLAIQLSFLYGSPRKSVRKIQLLRPPLNPATNTHIQKTLEP